MTDNPEELLSATLEAQHAEIQELIAQLRQGSFGLPDQVEDAPVGPVPTLRKLETLLRDHFALEEEGQYLEKALVLAPRFSDMATRLLQQHGEFLERLEEIIESHENRGQSGLSERSLARDVNRFADQLRNHDTAENQLIQAAYFDDQGGG